MSRGTHKKIKNGLGSSAGVVAKLVKKRGCLTFQLPKGYKIAPGGIEQAVREERDR